MRAVAYLRVSTPGQVEGYSLAAQERLFTELCKTRGWELVRTYREEGRSAHSDSLTKRPVFRQLLEDAAAGTFDTVVVHTLDRWARNLQVLTHSLSVLAKHNVGIVSISEQIDYSTPQGRLSIGMLGAFAQFYSDSLSTHIRKGMAERAKQGFRLGGIPFGYETCWYEAHGERKRRCDPEHPGGVHPHPTEAPAVAELFRRYAAGNTTTARLAAWLNDQGFRTRNTKRLPDGEGSTVEGPRRFTGWSLRVILHNAFYAGYVMHNGQRLQGVHEALISPELLETVETTLRRNNGRSETLSARPFRAYVLKGVARCAYCLMPMWAETYQNGRSYYREHYGSRSIRECPGQGGSMPCEVADEQIGRVMAAMELGPDWLERALARLAVTDEVERVKQERARVKERLRRLGLAFVDGVYAEGDYRRQKRGLELELETLVVPEVNATEEAGKLLQRLPELWAGATVQEKNELLLAMLEAVYLDTKAERRIVAIKPKAPFRPIFEVATTREGSGVVLIKEAPPAGQPEAVVETGPDSDRCFWWRRGGLELPNTPLRISPARVFLGGVWWRRGRAHLSYTPPSRKRWSPALRSALSSPRPFRCPRFIEP